MLVSALGFALMAACVKLVSTRGIPLLEIVAARALVSLVLSYIDVRRKGLSVWGTHRTLLAARGIVGSLALICVYYALMTLPLAEATLLQYMHPMFTALLGLLLLKEGIQRSTVICILFSITGLIVMVEPGVFTGAAPAGQAIESRRGRVRHHFLLSTRCTTAFRGDFRRSIRHARWTVSGAVTHGWNIHADRPTRPHPCYALWDRGKDRRLLLCSDYFCGGTGLGRVCRTAVTVDLCWWCTDHSRRALKCDQAVVEQDSGDQ